MSGAAPHRRVLLVAQRWGTEINGGAELHARQVASRLAERHDVEILTSCALSYATWDMHYAPGVDEVDGLPVHRFAHPPRNDIGRARVPRAHKMRFAARRLLGLLPGPRVAPPRGHAEYDGLDFLRRQGPHCPGLLQHLRQQRGAGDIAIFFTALYEPTALGLPLWGGRSILVPTLHDEKPMYLPHFHRVFAAAGRIFYNTAAEQRLARDMYGAPAGSVVGLGITAAAPPPAAAQAVRARLGLPARYLVYVGRIDPAKGCDELLAAHAALAREPDAPALVLVGQAFMPLPQRPGLHATGFVSEADRDAIVAGALALVLPSRYESLSMVLLEAMALAVPVVANADCEVLAEHVRHSGAGVVYRGRAALASALRAMAAQTAQSRQTLGSAGQAYVAQRYTWPQVMAAYDAAIDGLAQGAEG